MVMSIERTTKDIPQVDKSELLTRVMNPEMQTHSMASLEYTMELVLDMQIMTMDTLIAKGDIKLSAEQRVTYEKLKAYAQSLNTFNLTKSKFEIDGKHVLDYIFYFKDIVTKHRNEYFEVRERMESL